MTPRYSIRPHAPNADYPHAGGFARWDAVERRVVGWFKVKDEGERRCAELNGEEVPATLFDGKGGR